MKLNCLSEQTSNPANLEPSTKICVLSQEHLDAWRSTGNRPACEFHCHISQDTAMRWHDYPYWHAFSYTQWVARRALLVVPDEEVAGFIFKPMRTGKYGLGFTQTRWIRGSSRSHKPKHIYDPNSCAMSGPAFVRIPYDPSELPLSPVVHRDGLSGKWVSEFPEWQITMGGESCQLPDFLGVRYLHEILDGRKATVFSLLRTPRVSYGRTELATIKRTTGGLNSDHTREYIGLLSPDRIWYEINAAQDRAKAALAIGDKKRYEEEMHAATVLRMYDRQTIKKVKKNHTTFHIPRTFPTAIDLDRKAIASAISRAIEHIAKKGCPRTAEYFRKNIKEQYPDEYNTWRYIGDEIWQTHSGSPPCTDEQLELPAVKSRPEEKGPQIKYELAFFHFGPFTRQQYVERVVTPEEEAAEVQ